MVYTFSMKTSVIITTPLPSADEVADMLGINKKRRRELSELALSAIHQYDTKKDKLRIRSRRGTAVVAFKK
jgi:hypothetical protein